MLIAVINENQCIGCSRCIPACPVDAIIGTNKYMHTVLVDECIGCKLCVAPCPMDCISMVQQEIASQDKKERAYKAKQRYQARIRRLQKKQQLKLPSYTSKEHRKTIIQQEIEQAIARVKAKKQQG